MSATSDYQEELKTRGWIWLDQLPDGKRVRDQLGGGAIGRPGARSGWTPTGSQYELAPWLVQVEQGFSHAIDAIADADALGNLAVVEARDSLFDDVKDVLNDAAEATGLDHGLLGVIAKALGVPVWLLVVVLLFVLYGALRAYKIVPPIA